MLNPKPHVTSRMPCGFENECNKLLGELPSIPTSGTVFFNCESNLSKMDIYTYEFHLVPVLDKGAQAKGSPNCPATKVLKWTNHYSWRGRVPYGENHWCLHLQILIWQHPQNLRINSCNSCNALGDPFRIWNLSLAMHFLILYMIFSSWQEVHVLARGTWRTKGLFTTIYEKGSINMHLPCTHKYIQNKEALF